MTGQLTAGTFSVPKDARFAIVAARFNAFIVDSLLQGALDTLHRHGVDDTRIRVLRVPGAFELPVACKQLAQTGDVAAIIALGCVIRGGTPHFEYVSSGATLGLAQVAADSGVPVIFGVLTTNTARQAFDRSGDDADNKGREAALSALEMASLMHTLGKSR